MASFTTDKGSFNLQGGTTPIVINTDVLKARLVASSATPAKTDTNMSTNYTGIGTDQTLGTIVLTNDTVNNRTVYSCPNPTWSAVASGVVRYMVVYKFVTNDAGSTPIFVGQLGSDLTANGSDITCTSTATTTSGLGYTQQ